MKMVVNKRRRRVARRAAVVSKSRKAVKNQKVEWVKERRARRVLLEGNAASYLSLFIINTFF